MVNGLFVAYCCCEFNVFFQVTIEIQYGLFSRLARGIVANVIAVTAPLRRTFEIPMHMTNEYSSRYFSSKRTAIVLRIAQTKVKPPPLSSFQFLTNALILLVLHAAKRQTVNVLLIPKLLRTLCFCYKKKYHAKLPRNCKSKSINVTGFIVLKDRQDSPVGTSG